MSVQPTVLSPCRLKDSGGETINGQSAQSPIALVHPILFPFQMRPGSAGVKQDRLLEQTAYRKELGQPAG